ncbi:MAG: nuclear transport factor 2 family protein [Thermoleophilaceae bacterium]|nr:nuclear transport factor 2 family protein [Thermoleophilaceae bacterium]
MQEMHPGGRLSELVHRSYDYLAKEGSDAWIETFSTPDFVWDMTPMGLGRYEGGAAFREFFADWISSYDDWFLELEQVEEFAGDVVVNTVHQGGRMRESEQSVELRFVQVGVWEGSRVDRVVNYSDLEEARLAATELAAVD